MNYIALAIPAFFILIAVELAYARFKGLKLYRLNDAINNISCGILQQVGALLMAGGLLWGYVHIYQNWRLFEIHKELWWALPLCWLCVDFCYYWFHRLSHEVNFLWAAHLVHHQSEEYNLAVALRQSLFQQVFALFFYLPLAFIGFPPLLFVAASSFNTLYQFWIHTRAIKSLGFLEKILMTPSHHRVHHGRNPKYIDKNHGGTFIIWDKLFGTFQQEEEEPTYGITKPLESWNPVYANFHYWQELFTSARATSSWANKLRVFLKPPGWFPPELGGFQAPPELTGKEQKFDPGLPATANWYAFVGFTALNVGVFSYIWESGGPSQTSIVVGAVFIIWSIVSLGALLEGKTWFVVLEASRLAAVVALPLIIPPLAQMFIWVSLGLYAVIAGAWLIALVRNRTMTPSPT